MSFEASDNEMRPLAASVRAGHPVGGHELQGRRPEARVHDLISETCGGVFGRRRAFETVNPNDFSVENRRVEVERFLAVTVEKEVRFEFHSVSFRAPKASE